MTFPLTADQIKNGPFPLKIRLTELDDKIFSQSSRSVFIYIRNSGLSTDKLNLDFTALKYDQKLQYVLGYAYSDIHVTIKEIEKTWLCAFNRTYSDGCVFDENEFNDFIITFSCEIDLLKCYCRSLLFWIADIYAHKNNATVSNEWFSTTNSRPISDNFMNFVGNHGECLTSIIWNKDYELTNFDQCFIEKNLTTEQLKKIISLKYFPVIYGFRTPQWKQFTQLMSFYSNDSLADG